MRHFGRIEWVVGNYPEMQNMQSTCKLVSTVRSRLSIVCNNIYVTKDLELVIEEPFCSAAKPLNFARGHESGSSDRVVRARA